MNNRIDIEAVSTPYYIFDQDEFTRSVEGFKCALSKRFQKAIVSYSVKTNSLPVVLSLAKQYGAYAEVVSFDEYELAKLIGFPFDRIIYNGPMKSKETFLEAITNGAIVNLETHREIKWLEELPKDCIYSIGIRINIDLKVVSPKDSTSQMDESRFGFKCESGELNEAIIMINRLPNVRISGLHLHRTTYDRRPDFYYNLVMYAISIVDKFKLKIDYLDLGGGYFGIFKNKPSFDDYAESIMNAIKGSALNDVIIIVEPGNGLIASSFHFVTSVIDVKVDSDNRQFITTDGSRNDIDPWFRKSSYLLELEYSDSITVRPVIPNQIISGCTCLENDRIVEVYNEPSLMYGDKCIYRNVGAYTMCLSPLFIRYIPAVYMKQLNGDYIMVRDKWSAEDYIQKSFYK